MTLAVNPQSRYIVPMSETKDKANEVIANLIEDARAKCRVEFAAEAANLRNMINEAQAEFVDKLEVVFEAYFRVLATGKPGEKPKRTRGPVIASQAVCDNVYKVIDDVLRVPSEIHQLLHALGIEIGRPTLNAALRQMSDPAVWKIAEFGGRYRLPQPTGLPQHVTMMEVNGADVAETE